MKHFTNGISVPGVVLLVVALGACKPKSPPAPDAAAPVDVMGSRADAATAIASAPDSATPATFSAQPNVAEPSVADLVKEATPPEGNNAEGDGSDFARLTTAKGVLTVWALNDGDFSLILAAYPKTRASLVRRTSGRVADLQVVTMKDGDLAIGWASALRNESGQVSAVSFASVTLDRISAPVQLALRAQVQGTPHIALLKSPRGGVVAGYEGARASCKMAVHENALEQCPTAEIVRVALDRTIERLGTVLVEGGPSPEIWLVDIDNGPAMKGLLAYASSMVGGRTMAAKALAWSSKEAAPIYDAPSCIGMAGLPPQLLKGSRGETVCLDPGPRSGPEMKRCLKPLKGETDRCIRLAVTGADGIAITKKGADDTPMSNVACVDHKERLTFPGGELTLLTHSEYLDAFLPKPCR